MMTAMMESTERHERAWIVACSFLCGAIAGAAVATLLAPASGRELRQRLIARARQGRDRASDIVERGHAVVDRTRAGVQAQADHATRAVAEGRAVVADVRERAGRALEQIQGEATQAVADAGAAYRDIRSEMTGGRKE